MSLHAGLKVAAVESIRGPGNLILTNHEVWSSDGAWLVLDDRSDALGQQFDGRNIWAYAPRLRTWKLVYQAPPGVHCGAATWLNRSREIAFMRSADPPDERWPYRACHRSGVVVAWSSDSQPSRGATLEARDLVPPFTAGALRGGAHVFTEHPHQSWVSFTYEDHPCSEWAGAEPNRRTIALTDRSQPAPKVPAGWQQQPGLGFSVVISPTVAPEVARPGDCLRACEESWRPGTTDVLALGTFLSRKHQPIVELLQLKLPPSGPWRPQSKDQPLQGTATRYPGVPAGVESIRLTDTETRPLPGLGPLRFWPRACPAGRRVAFLMPDDHGRPQLTVLDLEQPDRPVANLTAGSPGVQSTFSWHPSWPGLLAVVAGALCYVPLKGPVQSLWRPPRGREFLPLACVVSPTGDAVATVTRGADDGVNQLEIGWFSS